MVIIHALGLVPQNAVSTSTLVVVTAFDPILLRAPCTSLFTPLVIETLLH